jgi:hypothetical protein
MKPHTGRSRLPPEVKARLAKRRGTKQQRELAFMAQAPAVAWPPDKTKLEKARDMVRERVPSDEPELFPHAHPARNRE